MATEIGILWMAMFLMVVQTSTTSPTDQETANHTNSTVPPCLLTTITQGIEPPMFESPEKGKVPFFLVKYSVKSSIKDSDVCELPVDKFLCQTNDCLIDAYQTFYPVFICDKMANLKVVFTNPKGIQSELLAYLHIMHCRVSVHNLGVYGQAADLKVIGLYACPIQEDPDESSILYEPEEQRSTAEMIDLEPIPGLDKVVGLGVFAEHAANISLPHVLYNRKWPAMAEIKLIGFETTMHEVNSFKRSMPNLQSLELASAHMLSVPTFPWDPAELALPLNLSRTRLFNDIYAEALGIKLEPHLFRRTLTVEKCNLQNISNIQFTGRLDMLSLEGNSIRELDVDTFSLIDGLYNLKLSSNLLTELPDGIFRNLHSLVQLDLSYNRIESIARSIFNGLDSLRVLYMSNNRLRIIIPHTFSPLSMLVSLDMSNNSIHSFADDAFGEDMPSNFMTVNLENNDMTHFPRWIFTSRSLTDTRLSRNKLSFDILKRDMDKFDEDIISLNNRESASSMVLPFKAHKQKVIDVSYNNFTSLDLANITLDKNKLHLFRVIHNYFRIDLKGNDIDCNCQTYSLYEFLKEEKAKPFLKDYSQPRVQEFHFRAWQCSKPENVKGTPIVEVNPDIFVCKTQSEGCPEQCDCMKRIFDGSIIVNCSARNLTHLPAFVPNMTDTVLCSHNAIKHIEHTNYFKSLKTLDLSNNYITMLPDDAHTSLDYISKVYLHNNRIDYIPVKFKDLQNVQITLGGNSFICDCHSRWVVRWIFSYRSNIPDINNVVCGSGIPRSQVIFLADEDDFICEISKATVEAIAISVGIILTLIIILLVVGHRFRGEIKVFLYFHFKWHPFDRTGSADVVDKLYDAFVSYNKADTYWVLHSLKPALENEERGYRLCIHERDFRPGGLVTDNVLFSVKYSRRMIMVLTKSFLKSEWCRLEFKSAHRRVLKDRTNYLIVILFDGLNIDDLDEDMKLYLKTNTYIEYSSKWFYQRLLYAMPEKPLSVLRKDAFPSGGYETLFPCPESVGIMHHIQNVRILDENPDAQVTPVVIESKYI